MLWDGGSRLAVAAAAAASCVGGPFWSILVQVIFQVWLGQLCKGLGVWFLLMGVYFLGSFSLSQYTALSLDAGGARLDLSFG